MRKLLTAAHANTASFATPRSPRSLQQAQDFWRLRDAFSEAQKGAGGSIKHDISVPVARIPEFLKRAASVVERVCPGARPVPFGHFGDGNLHYNVSQPEGMDRAAYLALWDADVGGDIRTRRGTRRLDFGRAWHRPDEARGVAAATRRAVELDMMRAIKQALDPKGILNPGKLL